MEVAVGNKGWGGLCNRLSILQMATVLKGAVRLQIECLPYDLRDESRQHMGYYNGWAL